MANSKEIPPAQKKDQKAAGEELHKGGDIKLQAVQGVFFQEYYPPSNRHASNLLEMASNLRAMASTREVEFTPPVLQNFRRTAGRGQWNGRAHRDDSQKGETEWGEVGGATYATYVTGTRWQVVFLFGHVTKVIEKEVFFFSGFIGWFAA